MNPNLSKPEKIRSKCKGQSAKVKVQSAKIKDKDQSAKFKGNELSLPKFQSSTIDASIIK